MRYDLHQKVKDKIEEGHNSAVIFEMVQLPKGADLNEWFAVHSKNSSLLTLLKP
jgi:hypothetical protein